MQVGQNSHKTDSNYKVEVSYSYAHFRLYMRFSFVGRVSCVLDEFIALILIVILILILLLVLLEKNGPNANLKSKI